jgi:hypothetical protein
MAYLKISQSAKRIALKKKNFSRSLQFNGYCLRKRGSYLKEAFSPVKTTSFYDAISPLPLGKFSVQSYPRICFSNRRRWIL